MKKRVLSVLTALALVLTMVPPAALAAEPGPGPGSTGPAEAERVVPDADSLPDNDELFAGYVEQVLYGDLMGGMEMFAAKDPAKNRLNELEQKAYESLKTKITTVAASGGSTEFTVTLHDLGITTTSEAFDFESGAQTLDVLGLTADDLDVTALYSGDKLTAEAENAIAAKFAFDGGAVISALLADLPFELYWFDKTTAYSMLSPLSRAVYAPSDGKVYLYGDAEFTLIVAGAYQDDSAGGKQTTTVKNVGATLNTVKQTAQEIVNKDYTSDYARLKAYKDEICGLVTYNEDALNEGTPYGDPWQLIYVFDKNTSTNVVCEGYSKAFQYLCDLTNAKESDGFTGAVDCYIVTGYMSATGNVDGAGAHMWNIVTIGSENYLVDVTNCDGDTPDDELFLVGAGENKNGDIAGSFSYTITNKDTGKEEKVTIQVPCNYEFAVSGGAGTMHYGYDVDSDVTTAQEAIWGKDVLTLAGTNYIQKKTPVVTAPTTTAQDYTPTLALAEFALTGGSAADPDNAATTVDGDWNWKDPNQLVGNAGTRSFKAVFMPHNANTYNSVEADVSVTVNQATITISGLTWSETSPVPYDGKAHAITITNLPDTVTAAYKYTISDTEVAAPTYVGTYAATAALTPKDSTNYKLSSNKEIFNLQISPVDQTPTAQTGSLTKGGSTLDLKTLISGAQGEITFTLSGSPQATLNGSTLTSGATTETVTVNYAITAKDVNGDGAAEYNAYTGGTLTVNIVDKLTENLAVTQSGITYGDTLAAPGYTKPSGAGEATVTYTGRNSTTYNNTAKPTEAGDYTVTVTCESATTIYSGSADFTIAKRNISGAAITLGAALTYTGSEQTQTVASVAVGGKTLTASDYAVSGNTGTNAGSSYELTVTAAGNNYTGTATKPFSIAKAGTTVAVDPATVNVKVNNTATFKATVTGLGSAKLTDTPVTVSANSAVTSSVGAADTGSAFPVTVTGKQAASVTLTVTYPGSANYKPSTATVTVVVTEKDPQVVEFSGLPLTDSKLTKEFGDDYSSAAAVTTPATGAGAITYSSSNTSVATIDQSGAVTIVGKGVTTIKAVAAAAGDYAEGVASYELTVTAKTVTPTVTVPGSFTYNGSYQTPAPEVDVGAVRLTPGTDYTVEYSNNKNAGTATVTVKPVETSNYTWAAAGVTGSFTIGQATGTKTASVYVKNDGTEQTVNLAALLPAGEPGRPSYTNPATLTNLDSATVTGGELSLVSKTDPGAPVSGTTEDVTVEVTGLDNYSTITITVTVTFTDKTPVTLSVTPAAELTYDGTAKDVTVADGPDEAAYTYTYTGTTAAGAPYSAATAPKAAGSYSVSVFFEDDDSIYTGNAAFTIAPKPVTVTGITETIKVGDAIPDPLYTTDGVVEGETLTPAPTVTGAPLDSSGTGTYTITVSGPNTSDDGNYTIHYDNGTLTIEARTPVATPTADPAGGTTFTDTLTVTLSCATEGASIYYTTDGSDPTSGTLYEGPINISDTTTIKAIAVKAGMINSPVVTATYTKEAPVEPVPVPVTGVSLNQSTLNLLVGGTAQLIATVVPADADNRSVIWSSSDTTVASVDGGVVTALRTGSAVITVTTVDGNFAASCEVTVTAPVNPPVNPGGGGTTPIVPPTPVVPSNPGSGNTSNNNNNNNNNSSNTPGTDNSNTSTDNNTSTPSTPSAPSVTPEATVSGGTASAVVSEDMASQLVDQAASSGSSTVVISPTISDSGVSRTEVSIPAAAVDGIASGSSAALKVETPAANITISNSGLSDLGGQDVVVAAEKVGNTVSVEITAGGQTVSSITGGLKAEIPAECGPGTVAQVVDENGNVLSTLRKSFASTGGDTMNVPLSGSAKVVFVDNSKSFTDVPASNWAANAVAFASGHELMNGVSATSFSPAEPMTRGMLAVVLHNLEGNPSASYSGSFGDVSGSAWYAEAVQWASDNSIIGGVGNGAFAPDSSITREQLVVMLYRYAGQPDVSGSALGGFSDADSVSGWAQQAMAWAVSSGIVGGSNGALNPQSGATRAEVAQMLMNFVSSGEI